MSSTATINQTHLVFPGYLFARMAKPGPSSDDLNYFRLCRLVINEGGRVLRTLLENKLLAKFPHCRTTNPRDRVDLQVVLRNGRVKYTLMNLPKQVLHYHYQQLLYPGNQPSTTVKVMDLDITLVVILLRNICSFNKHSHAWNNPHPGDTSAEADIGRLKCARNDLAHSSSTSITDNEFENIFKKIR